jgi:hypothetical protein
MKGIQIEETAAVGEHFALIYAPRAKRGRFPENCVEIVDSEVAARAGADSGKNIHPAKVVGPSRSSEGFRVFYLVTWLT